MIHRLNILACLLFLGLTQTHGDLVIDEFTNTAAQVSAGVNYGNVDQEIGVDVGVTVLEVEGTRFLVASATEPDDVTVAGNTQAEVFGGSFHFTATNSPTSNGPGEIKRPNIQASYLDFGIQNFTSFTEDAFKIDFVSSSNVEIEILIEDGASNADIGIVTVPDSLTPHSVLVPLSSFFTISDDPVLRSEITFMYFAFGLSEVSLGNETASAEIDKISLVAAVPEPGMLGLGAIGFCILAGYKRRKYEKFSFPEKPQDNIDRF